MTHARRTQCTGTVSGRGAQQETEMGLLDVINGMQNTEAANASRAYHLCVP
jgi:hypothetical protein